VIKYILLKKRYNVCMKTSRKIYAMNLFSNLIFYAPVALLVRTNRGISLSQFFVLQAILSVTCMVCEFPLGVLTDKIGLKKSIVLAQFTMLTARIILLVSNNFMLFSVEALLEGIAFALNSGTISAYIYMLFGDDNYSNNKNIWIRKRISNGSIYWGWGAEVCLYYGYYYTNYVEFGCS